MESGHGIKKSTIYQPWNKIGILPFIKTMGVFQTKAISYQ